MTNVAPFNIIGGPMQVYLGPVGEAFPDLDTDPPGGNWVLLAASGQDDYTEDGITINLDQELEFVRGLGRTTALKARRTTEDLKLGVTVMDMTAEQVSIALNANTVTTVAPGASAVGTREVGLTRGLDVTQYALLARGETPYVASGYADFRVPIVVVSSSQEITFKKGADVASLLMEFTAIDDPNAANDAERYGTLIETHLPQTA